jgi:hypothetical protein
MDDWNWDTNELCDWIINDESLEKEATRLARRGVTLREFEDAVRSFDLSECEVDFDEVDFEAIRDYLIGE